MSQFGAEGMGRTRQELPPDHDVLLPRHIFAQGASPLGRSPLACPASCAALHRAMPVVVLDRPGLERQQPRVVDRSAEAGGGKAVTSYRVVRGSGGLTVYAVSSARASKVKAGIGGAVTWRTTAVVSAARWPSRHGKRRHRLYRGHLEVKKGPSSVLAISRLRLEDYLRSVVSHEVPSSWTAAALRAQAVAARSYALTSQATARATHRSYDICDTTYCQAYGPISGESGAEIAGCEGDQRACTCRFAGQPVLAMFSSANGGYSVAGGRPYLVAQPDPYDGVVTGAANWGHQWSTSVNAGSIERSWPQIGRLQKVKVLGRDGNGQWGGRVLSVGLVGSKSTVTISADSFRWAVGLKSTWWTITNVDSGIKLRPRRCASNVEIDPLWSAGAHRHQAPVKGYRVTVSNADDTYRVGRNARKVRVKNLTNGKEYRAKVAPIYRSGPGPKTATSAFVPTSSYSYFEPMSARRVVDRKDTASEAHGGRVSAAVLGGGRAPESGTRAVAIRVSAESSRKAGRVTVWPCGAEDRSQVAVTYVASGSNTGLATVPVRSNGKVCLGASSSLTSLHVDLLGYYTSSGVGTKSLRAVAARRLVNSETGKGWSGGRLASGKPRAVQVAGREGVPNDVRTVLLSIGLVRPSSNATLSVAAPGTPVSLGAVVRAPKESWRTGTIVTRLDDKGRLPLRLTNGRSDVHVEVLGWFRPQTGDRSGRYRSTQTLTVLPQSAVLAAGHAKTVRVRGGDTGVPGAASAVVVQALARSRHQGYVTLQPTGSNKEQRPLLAFDRRGTQRALMVVPVGDDGQLTVTAKGADADVSLRVVGWYS